MSERDEMCHICQSVMGVIWAFYQLNYIGQIVPVGKLTLEWNPHAGPNQHLFNEGMIEVIDVASSEKRLLPWGAY